MSQTVINKALKNTLISPLTSDDLWVEFLEANSFEIANMEEYYKSIKNNWNINKNDKENLIRISQTFGYIPNMIINNTVDMCKREIESIPYRIKRKTTRTGYIFSLKQYYGHGDVFNYYWDGEKLVKSVDYVKTLKNLTIRNYQDNNYNGNYVNHHYLPFIGIEPSIRYISSLQSTMSLDYLLNNKIVKDVNNLRIYSLDQKLDNDDYWKLDVNYNSISTNHVGLEYFPEHYYCSYQTSLGLGENDLTSYSSKISFKNYYIHQSIKILINQIPLDINITVDNNKEFFSNSYPSSSEPKIDSVNSYYDYDTGEIHLAFIQDENFYKIIDKDIVISYDIDLMMTYDYFYYIETGMEYNKRCPIIPHSGIFLVADIAQGKGTDYYYSDSVLNPEGYTVPDLKLKAITCPAYNKYIGTNINFRNKFKYIAYGNNAQPIVSSEYYDLFNLSNLEFSYNMTSGNNSNTVYDYSPNENNCTITGDCIRVNGIFGKSLNFNGETYAKSSSMVSLDSDTNYSFGIWFKTDKLRTSGISCIYDGFITLNYDYSTNEIIINTDNNYNVDNDIPHFVCLTVNLTDLEINVYIDGEFKNSLSINSDNIIYNNYTYIGTNYNLSDNFYGLIDGLWIIKNELTSENVSYLYDNKLVSVINMNMGNKLAYYPLSKNEMYQGLSGDNNKYLMIQSYIEGKHINNEEFYLYDDNENYTFHTKLYPIIKPYFSITYSNSDNQKITLKTNERGEFYKKENDTVEIVDGSIDFDTGECKFKKNTIKSITQEVLASPTETLLNDVKCDINISNENQTWYINEGGNYVLLTGYDDYNTDVATSVTKISEYNVTTDTSSTKVYENDEDKNYYVKNGDDKKYVKAYTAVRDTDNNVLYSDDEGKTLTLNLADIVDYSYKIMSFVDSGENTATPLYIQVSYNYNTTANNTLNTAYLNTRCTKTIKKYSATYNNSTIYLYTLNNNNIYYTDLSFSMSIDSENLSQITQVSFIPAYYIKINVLETEFELDLEKIEKYYDKIKGIKNITSIINHPVEKYDNELVRTSVILNYWINDKKYEKKVNENGVIDADENISSGSFDFEHNTITINFINVLNNSVVISYEYYSSLNINTNIPISMDYYVTDMMINEIGLEDENHELLAYMIFPNIQFNSMWNNVSALFAINQSV